MIFVWILTLAIFAGQLIKLPFANFGGLITQDPIIAILIIIGAINLKLKFKKPTISIITGCIFLLLGITSFAITPLHLLPLEYFLSIFYPLRLLSYLIFAWIIFSGGFGDFDIKKVIIQSGLLLSIAGILQFIFLPDLRFLSNFGWDPHYFRAASTFLDPNFLGAYLIIPLLLITQNNFQSSKWNKFSFIIIFTTLILTFSRSSYLMFALSFLTFAILRRSVKMTFWTFVLSAILFLSFQIYTVTVSQPRNIDRNKSASYRLNTWQQGIDIFEKSPVFGVGYNSYRFALREYNLADTNFLKAHGSSTNDSSLLFVLATTGIIGLISYLTFLFFIARQNILAASIIIGLLAESFFNNSLFYPPIILTLLLVSILKFSKK